MSNSNYSSFLDEEAQVPVAVDPKLQARFDELRPSLTTEEYERLLSLGLTQPGDLMFIQKEDLDRVFFDSTNAAVDGTTSNNANKRCWLARRRLEFVLSEMRATYGGPSTDGDYALSGYRFLLALDDNSMHNFVRIARYNQKRTSLVEVPAIFHCAAWLYVILTVFSLLFFLSHL
jgi:hypothetical protein